MSDLYIKQKNGRYKKWGKLYDVFNEGLPYGIWLVSENSKENLEDRIIKKEDLRSVPLVANRLMVKNTILQYLVNKSTEENYTLEKLSNELAKVLVPSKKHIKSESKGLKLRQKRK